MLYSLRVRDLLLIDTLEINFSNGLTVVTGETGAGKSMLLKAIGLACGSRADASLIRPKCKQSEIELTFDLSEIDDDHALWQFLNDAEKEDSFLKLSRIILANGRSKIFINEQPSTLANIKKISQYLLTVFGQFDDPLEENLHSIWLDAWLPKKELQMCSSRFSIYKDLRKRYIHFLNEKESLEQTRVLLLEDKKTLDILDLKDSEESNLLTEKKDIAHLGRSADALVEILDSVSKRDILSTLHDITGRVERIGIDEDKTLQNLFHCFHTSSLELEAGISSVKEILEQTKDTHKRYQEIDERVHLLRNIALRFKCEPDELATVLKNINDKLVSLDSFEQDLLELKKEFEKERNHYLDQAKHLQSLRIKMAEKLSQSIMFELKDLKLQQVQFRVHLNEKPEENWSTTGIDDVTFEVETNSGMGFSPLVEIASGGELSRLALALQITMRRVLPPTTMIFDEIDTGVGGAVSNAIGSRLKKLSESSQIITITHAPQVAAWADTHLIVQKTTGDNPKSTLVTLTDGQRVNELARMLSGDDVTIEAINASQALFREVEKCT